MSDRTILIADQDQTSRTYITHALKGRNYKFLEAGTGKEALIFAWRDAPDVILFDPALPDIDAIEFIEKLRRNQRTQKTLLIGLAADPSATRKQACLDAGVDVYVIKSPDAVNSVKQALDRLTESGAEGSQLPEWAAKQKGLLFVFLSAKGGAGTSSLCANLAMAIQEQQPDSRVVVADLVLPIGSIAQIVGYMEDQNLANVADLPPEKTDVDFFHKNLPKPEKWKFQLLPGSPDPFQANQLEGKRIDQIMDTLLDAFDFVIVDIGRGLSRITLPLIQQADLIPLIISTDRSTIELTRTVWEYLSGQGVSKQKVYAIYNRAVGLEGLTKSESEEILGFPIKNTLPYLGGNFALANNLHQPVITKYAKETIALLLKETAKDMVKLARELRDRVLK